MITTLALLIQFLYYEIYFAINDKSKKHFKLINFFICIILLLVSISSICNTHFSKKPFKDSYYKNKPLSLTRYINNNPELKSRQVLNPYSWGGYLLWQVPEMKLFIDGRMPQTHYKTHSLLEEYNTFFDEAELPAKLNEYNIDMVIIKKDKDYNLGQLEMKFLGLSKDVLKAPENKLTTFLGSSEDWGKIYEDNLSELYIQKNETICNSADL